MFFFFFSDVFCPEKLDTCHSVVCPAHQVCRHEPYQTPQCVCPEGRSGQNCEAEDRCTDASCLNGKYHVRRHKAVAFRSKSSGI